MKDAHNGKLSGAQIFCLLALFLSGGVGTMGGGGASRDAWLLMLAAGAAAAAVYPVYVRLAVPEGGADGFERAFGPAAGRAVRKALGAAAVLTAAVDLRVSADFTAATALPHSPRIVFAAIMAGVLIAVLRAGTEALGRAAGPAFAVVFGMLALSFAAAWTQLDWGAVLPIGETGAFSLLQNFVRGSIVPFLEGFFALWVFAPMHNRQRPARPAVAAALFAGVFLGSVLMKNIMLLGYPAGGRYFFPSYTAASVTVISEFLQRQELLVAVPFLMCELFKASLCLMFAVRALGVRRRRLWEPALCAAAAGISLLGRGGVAEAIAPLRFYGQWLFLPLFVVPAAAAVTAALRAKTGCNHKK